MHDNQESKIKAWLITADMGYGHQRAIYPLRLIAEEGIITVGKTDSSEPSEKILWKRMLQSYEYFSRASSIPVLGKPFFGLLDSLMSIPAFYPIRDLSQSTFQVSILYSFIRKGLCTGLFNKVDKNCIPLISSFYAPAIAADIHGYESVYCIICDSDINRVWVAREPWDSKIIYFAPCSKVVQRLKSYGVPNEKIYLTGFPLDQELIGDRRLSRLKKDLGQRLHYLDPSNKFWPLHSKSIEHFLGTENCVFRKERKLNITYSVGGAGAQKEIAGKIITALREKLRKGEVKLNLAAGNRKEINEYFEKIVRENPDIKDSVEIIFNNDLYRYFDRFNEIIRVTDILWTKPSELSFYCALGIPIIMTPAIGSQEKFNSKWLKEINAGIKQKKLEYIDQWLVDMLESGRLAEAAWAGFLKARKLGTYKIMEVLLNGKLLQENSPVLK